MQELPRTTWVIGSFDEEAKTPGRPLYQAYQVYPYPHLWGRDASFVDGHNRPGSTRWRLTSQSSSEIVLYDAGRDLYTRFDLAARKGAQRRGASGNWITTSEILSIDCH